MIRLFSVVAGILLCLAATGSSPTYALGATPIGQNVHDGYPCKEVESQLIPFVCEFHFLTQGQQDRRLTVSFSAKAVSSLREGIGLDGALVYLLDEGASADGGLTSQAEPDVVSVDMAKKSIWKCIVECGKKKVLSLGFFALVCISAVIIAVLALAIAPEAVGLCIGVAGGVLTNFIDCIDECRTGCT